MPNPLHRSGRRSGVSPSIAALFVVTGTVFGGAASAQAAEAVAAARATILAPVAVTGEAVRLAIEPGGDLDCGVEVACAGLIGAGTVQVSGSEASGYSLTLPGKTTIFSGAHSLTLDHFTARLSAAANPGNGGADRIPIGATLRFPPGQPAGNYSGNFVVILEYQ